MLLVLALANGGNDRRTTYAPSQTYSSASRLPTGSGAVSPPAGIRMDATERTIYSRDPSSMGYTDADRDFLREHGVSEAEARAAESVLRDHGIN